MLIQELPYIAFFFARSHTLIQIGILITQVHVIYVFIFEIKKKKKQLCIDITYRFQKRNIQCCFFINSFIFHSLIFRIKFFGIMI